MPKSAMFKRNDIYYCSCCAKFYNWSTHEYVNIKYTDMPAELALEVMQDRYLLAQIEHIEYQRRSKRKRPNKAISQNFN